MHYLLYFIPTVKPSIEYEQKFKGLIQVKGGNSLIINTNLKGEPAPSVTWTLDGTPLVANNKVSMETGVDYSTLTIRNTDGRDSGNYKITASNHAGSDSAEFEVRVIDKPSAPRDLGVTKTHKDYISLAWEAPEKDGGSEVTGYVIEKRDMSKTSWTNAGQCSARDFKVTRLTEGKSYLFRVAAENKIGTGDWAEIREAVKAELPFRK